MDQKIRIMVGSTLAVLAAMGLYAAATFALPAPVSNQTQTTTGPYGIYCPPASVSISNLPPLISLRENGTATINGSTYWYVSFISGWTKANESTIMYHGVNFTLTIPFARGPKNQTLEETIYNATELYFYRTASSYELPPIKIAFPNGSSQIYNRETITVGPTSEMITFDKPMSNPWLTAHVGPQAGIGYQVCGGEITLYVTTS